MRSVLTIGTAALLLASCEMSVGRDDEGKAGANAAAPAQARDGEISIDTPGFDMKLDIPDAIRSELSGDNDTIYPGSKVDGLNVTARENAGKGSQVQIRFSSTDAPAKVAAWYRDPARAAALTGVSVQQDGNGFKVSGSAASGGDPFDLRLSPASGGGTQGQLTLRDAN